MDDRTLVINQRIGSFVVTAIRGKMITVLCDCGNSKDYKRSYIYNNTIGPKMCAECNARIRGQGDGMIGMGDKPKQKYPILDEKLEAQMIADFIKEKKNGK